MSKVKEAVVKAWVAEQFELGVLSGQDILSISNCSTNEELTAQIKVLAEKANDYTPVEILEGYPISYVP